MKTKKKEKPTTAFMAYNFGNPWTFTARLLRKDCVAAVKENLIDPKRDIKAFTIRKVIITPSA